MKVWEDTHKNIILVIENIGMIECSFPLWSCVFPNFFKLGNHDDLVICGVERPYTYIAELTPSWKKFRMLTLCGLDRPQSENWKREICKISSFLNPNSAINWITIPVGKMMEGHWKCYQRPKDVVVQKRKHQRKNNTYI